MNECIYCKSTEIEKDVQIATKVSGQPPAGSGPYHCTKEKSFLGQQQKTCQIEPMFAAICKQCGGVMLYVKNVDRNWEKQDLSRNKTALIFL